MKKLSKADLERLVDKYTRDNVERKRRANSYTQNYRAKMTENGFVSVNVWVPKDRKGELQQIAAQMRSEAAEK